MKHKLLSGLFMLLFAQLSMAQLTLNWAKFVKGQSSTGNAVATDFNGNLALAGTFQYAADFDPGVDTLLFNAGSGVNVFVQKLDPQGNLLWARRLLGASNVKLNDVTFDQQGNVLLLGSFSGNLQVNPGTTFYSSVQDVFIVKFDPDGSFLWGKQIGGANGSEAGYAIAADDNGNVYSTGFYQATTDFDPDPNASFTMTTAQTYGMFILKLNAAGQFVWAKSTVGLSGTSSIGRAMAVRDGNIYMTGEFFGVMDFDPGPDVQNIDAVTFRDAFVLKLDYDGNYVWAKHISGTGIKIGYGLALDPSGNILTVGIFNAKIDLDPGPGVTQYQATGTDFTYDIFLQKLDPDGNFVWGKKTGDYLEQSASAVATDKFGNVYTTGSFTYSTDFNPGTGTTNLTSAGGTDIFVQKLDATGNFVEAKRIGGTVDDNGLDLVVDKFNDVVLAGNFKGVVDADPGTGIFFMDNGINVAAFALKMGQPWDYRGKVFQDLNNNQVQDAGEPGVHGVVVQAQNRQLYATTDSAGAYHLQYNLEGDTIRPFVRPYWQMSPATITAGAVQTGYNFATQIPAVEDLQVSVVEVTHFRPGFETAVIVQVKNVGTLPVAQVPLTFKIVKPEVPSPLYAISMDPVPDAATDKEFSWLLGPLAVGKIHTLQLVFRSPISVTNGTEILLTADVNLAGDAYPADNHFAAKSYSAGSHDPNDKTVRPENVPVEALDTSDLQYVIRFQNTGTLPADFVMIRDTLPLGLDLSTLRVLAGSHAPFTWRLYGPRLLEFMFKPINLPDSTSNEPGSHGFVLFSVKAKKDLPLGTLVKNRAGIYFDFNPPVMTNTAIMRVGATVGTQNLDTYQALDFGLFPNPIAAQAPVQLVLPDKITGRTQITVTDTQGKTLYTFQLESGEKKFWLKGLPSGSYFIQVQTGTHAGAKLLMVK